MSSFELYLEKLRDDMLWQFKGKPNTDGLLKTIAKQFDDIYTAFHQLMTLRWIDTAGGIQLDRIGDIVILSRIQATKLEEIRREKPTGTIDDETYRLWLRYKMFVNTFDGTYRSFMRTINMFWQETELYYSEELAHPATIFLDTPDMPGTFDPIELYSIPFIKPGGVQLILRSNTKTDLDNQNLSIGGISNAKITETRLEEQLPEFRADLAIGITMSEMFTVTELPEQQ